MNFVFRFSLFCLGAKEARNVNFFIKIWTFEKAKTCEMVFGHGCPFNAPAKYRCHRGSSSTTADRALPSESLRACSHLCLKGHQNQNTGGADLGRCHHTRPDASFQVGADSHIESKQMGVGSKRSAQPAQSPKLDVQSWETKEKVFVIPHTGMLVLRALFANDS